MLRQLKKGYQTIDCICEECEANSLEIDLEPEQDRRPYSKKKNGRTSQQQYLQQRYKNGDPKIGLLGEPSGKIDYYVLYSKQKKSNPDSPPLDNENNWPNFPPKPPPPLILQPYYHKALDLLEKKQKQNPTP